MNHDEILQGLYDQTLVGNAPAVLDLTNEGLATGSRRSACCSRR